MNEEKKLAVYSITDLDVPPVPLQRRCVRGPFYQHIPVPLPDQIVIFALGSEQENLHGSEITVTYKDCSLTLGSLNSNSKSVCWERSKATVPAVMVSKKEKGMAKLLVEPCDTDTQLSNEPPVLKSQTDISTSLVPTDIKTGAVDQKTLNENTPQLAEQIKNTPDRPQKSKRKSSLNKSEQTPTGPSAKKQKTQKTSARTRNSKKDSKSESPANSSLDSPETFDKENQDGNILNRTEDNKKSTVPSPFTKSMSSGKGKQKVAICKDLTTRASRPSSRWGHSLCFVNKNLSVLIGGQGDKQQLCKDSVWLLDTETRKWKNPEVPSEGQKPEYRMGHTATYDPMMRCIYVYGGSKHTRWFHDVHMLDVDEWKWQLVKVSGKAPTRAYHSATLYRHELWIFGGVYPRPDPQPDGCSNEIHIFSPVMQSWYSPIISGEKPLARSGHSATLINDQLVVFGGWDAPISYSDLHILDMSIVEWTKPEVKGAPPKPRSWHASCALSGKRILIHGGYDGNLALEDTFIFNLEQLSWTQIAVDSKPMARTGHSALCMPYRHDNEEEDEVIIFGGGDNDGAYFDDLLNILVPFSPAAIA